MGLEGLNFNEIIYGTFSLIFVIIAFLMGMKILAKYFTLKRNEILSLGLGLIFLSSAWWGSVAAFISYVIFNQEIEPFLFFFLGDFFIPIAIISWMYSFTTLVYPHLKKKIVPLYLLIYIPYEVILIILLTIDPMLVATIEGKFNSDHEIFFLSFLIFTVLSFTITGIMFGRESIKSNDLELKWKGRFFIIGVTFFTIGAIFDAGIPMNALTLIIIRLILIGSIIAYYLGLFLPDKLASKLISKS